MTDPIDTLRRIGVRAPKDSLQALLSQASRNKPAPVQLLEVLTAMQGGHTLTPCWL